jgi:hypothetical protein
MAYYGDSFTILYAYDIRTLQGTHLWASTACYGDSFTFLYVNDVRTSQETHLWASGAFYGDRISIILLKKSARSAVRYQFF